jgi:hypothetical protein
MAEHMSGAEALDEWVRAQLRADEATLLAALHAEHAEPGLLTKDEIADFDHRLRNLEFSRRRLDEGDEVCRQLAVTYATRPGYLDEWRPNTALR